MFLSTGKAKNKTASATNPKTEFLSWKKKDILYNSKMNSKITGVKHLEQKKSVNVQISQTQ